MLLVVQQAELRALVAIPVVADALDRAALVAAGEAAQREGSRCDKLLTNCGTSPQFLASLDVSIQVGEHGELATPAADAYTYEAFLAIVRKDDRQFLFGDKGALPHLATTDDATLTVGIDRGRVVIVDRIFNGGSLQRDAAGSQHGLGDVNGLLPIVLRFDGNDLKQFFIG
ncbi:MAG TPA: hypothetical protein VMB70_13975 [Terriglobia bacterium]|nr:hypothetical protein [Terriglobia bacterium]